MYDPAGGLVQKTNHPSLDFFLRWGVQQMSSTAITSTTSFFLRNGDELGCRIEAARFKSLGWKWWKIPPASMLVLVQLITYLPFILQLKVTKGFDLTAKRLCNDLCWAFTWLNLDSTKLLVACSLHRGCVPSLNSTRMPQIPLFFDDQCTWSHTWFTHRWSDWMSQSKCLTRYVLEIRLYIYIYIYVQDLRSNVYICILSFCWLVLFTYVFGLKTSDTCMLICM